MNVVDETSRWLDSDQATCSRCGGTLAEGATLCGKCWMPRDRGERSSPGLPDYEVPGLRKSPESIVALMIIGIILIVFAALRWNSAASQIVRAFGGSDGLAVFLFLGGAASFGTGLYFQLSANDGAVAAASSLSRTAEMRDLTTQPPSVEARLRQLDELRAKSLVSEDEYSEAKAKIISAI